MDRQTEREVIIACVLGDGCLAQHGRWDSTWLQFKHCQAQLDYLLWKVKQIEATRLVRGKRFTVRDAVKYRHANGHEYVLCTANMYGVKYFRILRKWLYPAGQKTPSRVLRYLSTPFTLAVLFMDDGCVEKRKRKHLDGTVYYLSPRLSLAFFQPEDESLEFLTWVATTFGVQGYPTLRKRKDVDAEPYYVLMFNSENSRLVWELIAPYVYQIPSMQRKFAYCIEYWGWPLSTTEVARVPGDSSDKDESKI